MVDLNNDGLKEAVLIPYNSKWSSGNAVFYHQLAKNQYEFGGAINLGYWGEKNQLEKMMAEIELGHFKVVAPKFNDIELGNEQIKVIAK